MKCNRCQTPKPDKGRADDWRRAYRCRNCGHTWTQGMQGRTPRQPKQRRGYQFRDTLPPTEGNDK